MKKLILLLIIISSLVSAQSFRVEFDDARSTAHNFLEQQKNKESSQAGISITKSIQGLLLSNDTYSLINIKDSNDTLAYVINLIPEGFIVVANDKRLNPILAHSYNGKFDPNLNDPENILYQMLQQDIPIYKSEVSKKNFPKILQNNVKSAWEDLDNNTVILQNTDEITAWPSDKNGWIETKWDQGDPYNIYCPTDDQSNNNRSLTGCVATAMAQIINYWGNTTSLPISFEFNSSDNYTTETRGFSIDATTASIDNITYPLDNDGIARLIFACGVSVKMDYTAEGSGAFTANVADVLKNKLFFESANVISGTEADFFQSLTDNNKKARPSQLSIKWPGNQNSNFHSIVCDGYKIENEVEYYHFNYGWSGAYQETWYNIL